MKGRSKQCRDEPKFLHNLNLPQSSALYPSVERRNNWRKEPETELPSPLNHYPMAAAHQGWKSAPKLHKTSLISNQGHSHRVSHILSKEREGELLNIYNLHSRGEKKREKNQFRTVVTTINTANFGGESGGISREKKGWNKGKHKIRPTRGD